MSEPRIAIKVVNNRFVSCFEMPEPKYEELWPQNVKTPQYHRHQPFELRGLAEYALTKADHAD